MHGSNWDDCDSWETGYDEVCDEPTISHYVASAEGCYWHFCHKHTPSIDEADHMGLQPLSYEEVIVLGVLDL